MLRFLEIKSLWIINNRYCVSSAYTLSLVTPGVSCTIEILFPANLLNNVDLPTLGLPTIATICFATIFPPDKLYF